MWRFWGRCRVAPLTTPTRKTTSIVSLPPMLPRAIAAGWKLGCRMPSMRSWSAARRTELGPPSKQHVSSQQLEPYRAAWCRWWVRRRHGLARRAGGTTTGRRGYRGMERITIWTATETTTSIHKTINTSRFLFLLTLLIVALGSGDTLAPELQEHQQVPLCLVELESAQSFILALMEALLMKIHYLMQTHSRVCPGRLLPAFRSA